MTETSSTTKRDLIAELQHYVRVTKVLHNKFVEFEFSIGDPTLCVELVLPFREFEEFRDRHKAQELSAEQVNAVEYDRLKWRYGKPGQQDEVAS